MSEDKATQQALSTGKTFPWHELYSPNLQPALDFYTQALGFEATSMDMGEMGSYHMLSMNGNPVCGVLGTKEDPRLTDVPPHWAAYLSVDDVDARIAKVEALGGKVMVPAMDIPTIGRMALIVDPFGATLWLFKPAAM